VTPVRHRSRPFQVASHPRYTLRMALLVNESRIRVGAPVRVAARAGDAPALTHGLGAGSDRPRPMPGFGLGAAT